MDFATVTNPPPRWCKAARRSGERCLHPAVAGSDYCRMHGGGAAGLVTVSVPVEMEDDIRQYIAHIYAARALGESAGLERYEPLLRRMSALLDPKDLAAKIMAAAQEGIREGSREGSRRGRAAGQRPRGDLDRLPEEVLLDLATTAVAQAALLNTLYGGPAAVRAAAEVESLRKTLSAVGVDAQRIAAAFLAGHVRAVEVMRILDSKVKPEDTDE